MYEPFCLLIDGILQGFKFDHIGETREDLIQEGIFFLLDGRLEMFNADYGAKAYSYFGTALKRYFIVRNSEAYKKKQDHVPVENIPDDIPYYDTDYSVNYVEELTSNLTYSLDEIFFDEEERDVAGKILKSWQQSADLSLFKKSSLYIHMQLEHGIPQATTIKVLNDLKKNI